MTQDETSQDFDPARGAAAPGGKPPSNTEPRILAVQLQGQQLAMYEAICQHNEELADRYLGARVALNTLGNPERFVHAAHSLRELMNDLHRIGDVPVQASGGRLGDKFDSMRAKWEKAKRRSDCYSEEGEWAG